MTLDEFASKLSKPKIASILGHRGFRARCPAHDDKVPSFAVWEGKDGYLHVKCQKGCTESEILGAMGLRDEDRRLNGAMKQEPKAVYVYEDASGGFLFEKVRLLKDGKKDFRLRQKNQAGEYVYKMDKGWNQTLYRMPEVAKAQTVYVNEGEKAADAFSKRGLAGTCQPTGAEGGRPEAKWTTTHTQALAGKHCIVVADRDVVGESYARYVASQLKGVCLSVKVVQSKTENEKDDAYDHFEAGFGIGDFMRRKDLERDAGARPEMQWRTAAEIEPQVTEWLWEPYIPLGEVTLLVGDPGVGKSTLAQAVATATTLGAEIMGKRFAEGPVVFLSAEQSVSRVTVPRFRDMGANLSKIILPDDEADDEIIPYVLDASGVNELANVCAEVGPKLIVIDTITAYIEGARDMNSANHVREWIRRLGEIARRHEAALVVLGHYNKNSQAKAIYRIVGSIDFVGASRSVLACGIDPDDHTIRAADHIKSNVGPLGKPIGFTVDHGEFQWTGESELTAERMFEPKSNGRGKQGACEEWMRSRLAGGPVDAAEMLRESGSMFPERAVRGARKALGVITERDKFGEDGKWQWRLPSQEVWWNQD